MAKRPASHKTRIDLRRNRDTRQRLTNLTEQARQGDAGDQAQGEAFHGKGSLTRKRTVDATRLHGDPGELEAGTRLGVVTRVFGAFTEVDADGVLHLCSLRQVLKTMRTAMRHVVVVGDRVGFRPAVNEDEAKAVAADAVTHAISDDLSQLPAGVIERVLPRTGELCRWSRQRWHTIAANIDQLLIVVSSTDPPPSPHLIDRYLIAADAGRLSSQIVVNKVDLPDGDAQLEAVRAIYEPLGVGILGTSARRGDGMDALRAAMRGRCSAVAGQSGVGKSSLLNSAFPGLDLRTGQVSDWWQRGRHTTTTAVLIRVPGGDGFVIDTPGVRQLSLWQMDPGQLAASFDEMAPLIAGCRFSDCTHTHETGCAVKQAVGRGELHPSRYDSYCKLLAETREPS